MNKNYHISNITNLCYIIKGGDVLLQKKSRGFGEGKWNAPGGKKYKDETPEEATVREVKEETDLDVYNLRLRGRHEFLFEGKPEWNNECYIFTTDHFIGKEKDMGEGELKWFGINEIPLDEMWDDDRFWTKDMLNGEYKEMRFYFDHFGNYLRHEDILKLSHKK